MRAAATATLRTFPLAAEAVHGALARARDWLGARSPQARRRMAAAALACFLLGALYLGWFRDSSFVRVEDVTVTGLTTPDAPRVRARLTAAARGMSTMLCGVAPGDPATFATAIGVVALAAFAGSVVPALRAKHVNPMSVLKAE